MGYLAVLLLPPLALVLLFIYCFSQKTPTRPLKPALIGLVLGGVGGFALLLGQHSDLTYLDAGMFPVVLLLLVGIGAAIGAYVGVGGAECLSPDANRRSAARRGAIYGLAGAAVLSFLCLVG